MRNTYLLVFGLGVLTLAAPVQAQQPNAARDSAAIVALELEMASLLERGEFDEYSRHLAAHYVRTFAGELQSRAQALAAWRARGPGQPVRPTQMSVRVYGDAAVLTAMLAGPDGGREIRITKTFVRSDGEWLLAALHGCSQD